MVRIEKVSTRFYQFHVWSRLVVLLTNVCQMWIIIPKNTRLAIEIIEPVAATVGRPSLIKVENITRRQDKIGIQGLFEGFHPVDRLW